MDLIPMKLVTIIGEAVLEDRLTAAVRRLGATGYSVSQARGEGSRGVRASVWGGSNVKIESIVNARACDAIIEHIAHEYFPNYAVIAWVTDVQVVRGEKYGA